jgi:hypothetical protein
MMNINAQNHSIPISFIKKKPFAMGIMPFHPGSPAFTKINHKLANISTTIPSWTTIITLSMMHTS